MFHRQNWLNLILILSTVVSACATTPPTGGVTEDKVKISASTSFSLVVGAQELHLIDPNSWAQQPVSSKTIDLRIDRAASDYERYGRVARIALFDIAFPANAVEYESLEGYG